MISEELKKHRKALGMMLEELAERIGTSKQTIHRYENGTISNIPPEKVEALATALQTTPAALMGWREDDAPLSAPIAHKRLPCLAALPAARRFTPPANMEASAHRATILMQTFASQPAGTP